VPDADERPAQRRPGGVQEQVAGGRDATSDHHDLGVEGRHQVGQPDAEPRAHGGERRQRHRVAGLGGGGDHRAGQLLGVALAQPLQHRGVAQARPRRPGQGVAAGVLLPAAPAAALAGETVGHDLHVAELPGHAVAPPVHPAADDDGTADPGPQGDDDAVPRAAGRAVRALGTRGAVGVVVQDHRRGPALHQPGPDLLAAERQVRREHDPLPRRVHEPGRGDADPVDATPAGDVLHRLGERVLHGRGLHGAAGRRAARGAHQAPRGRHGGGEHLGAPDVDPDEEWHC